ncbi:MAG: LysR family transcriptional regulator [Beijerinckiaceae bacterium]|nr:LysR family transcriptional regulator [Beijerinckiaceae bacterium]
MELRHLRYFCAVAEEMHVTRAAERLRVAQSALTQQIKALEAELHTPLLRRAGRGIELTEAGVAFWPEARAVLERVRSAVLIAQETGRGFAGRITIGLTETASFATPVTAVLKEARERWPCVEFNLIQARSNDLVPALVDRRIDVAFMRSPAPEIDTLTWRPFLTEGLVVVLPDTHPLASRRSIELSELGAEPLILPRGRTSDRAMRNLISAAFEKVGCTPKIAQETPEYIMAINLVAAGIGLSVVPAALTGMRRNGVVYRPLRSTPPLLTEIIVVTRAGDPAPVTANFIALTSEQSLRLGLSKHP